MSGFFGSTLLLFCSGQFSSVLECQKNGHCASPHPGRDDGKELATQIESGDTIHNQPQDKKSLWPGPAGLLLENGWLPSRAVREEGQHLSCARLLIFQGEWSLELLNIPRRAINLILVSFNCRMKWPVFLAIFISPLSPLPSDSLAHRLMTSFLPSSPGLFPF